MHRISRIATLGASDGGSTGEDKERARNGSARKVEKGVEKLKVLFCVLPRSRRLDGSEDLHGKNNNSETIGTPTLYSGYTSAYNSLINLVRMTLLSLKFPLTGHETPWLT